MCDLLIKFIIKINLTKRGWANQEQWVECSVLFKKNLLHALLSQFKFLLLDAQPINNYTRMPDESEKTSNQ